MLLVQLLGQAILHSLVFESLGEKYWRGILHSLVFESLGEKYWRGILLRKKLIPCIV